MFPTPSARILVVDDDPAIRDLLATFLDEEGYAVTVAPDGPTALEIAVAQFPDLVLTDVGLPGIDGPALGALLRLRGFAGPIVLMTAGSGQAAACATDPVPVVRKPFDLDALRGALAGALAGADRANAWVNIKDAAVLAEVSRQSIHNWIVRGRLQAVVTEDGRVLDSEELNRFLMMRRAASTAGIKIDTLRRWLDETAGV